MGSAFSPLADDATAAVNNPAGLVQLSRREISFEMRYRQIETPFLVGGRLSGLVTNRGLDVLAGPVYGTTLDANLFPSFGSFVFPLGRVAIAAYSHQFVKTDQDFRRNGVLGLFTTPQGVIQDAREPPQIVTRQVAVTTHGFSLGYTINDRLTVGAGVAANDFSFHESSTRYATVGIDLISFDPVHPSVYGEPDFTRTASGGFSSRREVVSPRVDGDDVALSFNAGVLFRLNRMIRLGGVVRRGPQFEFDLILPDNTRSSGTFAVPSSYTAGIVVQPTDRLAIVLDYSRLQYSSLERGFVDTIVGPGSEPAQFSIENGDELHIGVEYVLTQLPGTPAIRLGGWYDPAHGVYFERSATLNPFFNDLFSSALEGGDDVIHYTGGVGLSFNRHVEFNAAADLTTLNKLFSASAIFRF